MDSRLLATPSVAIAECANKTVEMARLAEDTILCSLSLLDKYSEKAAEEVIRNEDRLDLYEDQLGTILVQLSSKALSDEDSRNVSKQLHTIGDFERIGDHALNLVGTAQEIYEKEIRFSGPASGELSTLLAALTEILDVTTRAFAQNDLSLAVKVEPLEQVIDQLKEQLRTRHILRLQKGDCTIDAGFTWLDLLTNLERTADHCSNIAGCVIDAAHDMMNLHQSLREVRNGSEEFQERYREYRRRYALT